MVRILALCHVQSAHLNGSVLSWTEKNIKNTKGGWIKLDRTKPCMFAVSKNDFAESVRSCKCRTNCRSACCFNVFVVWLSLDEYIYLFEVTKRFQSLDGEWDVGGDYAQEKKIQWKSFFSCLFNSCFMNCYWTHLERMSIFMLKYYSSF